MRAYRYLRYLIAALWAVFLYGSVFFYSRFLADPEEYTRYHGEGVDYTVYHIGGIFRIVWTALGVLFPLLPARYGRKAVKIHGYLTLGLLAALIIRGVWLVESGAL